MRGQYEDQKGKRMISRNLTVVALLILLAIVGGCTISKEYGPYCGKVVDKETKEPIEGAAVLIVFNTVSATVGGAVYHYADAVETITDKNGEFMFAQHRIVSPEILRRWDEYGYVTIFKPGYGCYPDHKDVKPMFIPNGSIPEKQHVAFELPKFITKAERLDMPSVNFDIPYEKQEKLVELINQEMESLGATGKYTRESFRRRRP